MDETSRRPQTFVWTRTFDFLQQFALVRLVPSKSPYHVVLRDAKGCPTQLR